MFDELKDDLHRSSPMTPHPRVFSTHLSRLQACVWWLGPWVSLEFSRESGMFHSEAEVSPIRTEWIHDLSLGKVEEKTVLLLAISSSMNWACHFFLGTPSTLAGPPISTIISWVAVATSPSCLAKDGSRGTEVDVFQKLSGKNGTRL